MFHAVDGRRRDSHGGGYSRDAQGGRGQDEFEYRRRAKSQTYVRARARKRFGSQCIVVAIDAKRSAEGRWEVYTHGGRKPTGLDAVEWARRVEALGAGEILLTSMDADGTKAGYDVALTCAISEAVHIPVIASGGAGTLDHMVEVLTQGKADAVLAASVFHFGEYTVAQAKEFLQDNGICVRL